MALWPVFNYQYNETKDKYYEGHITLNDVNIGIALPGGIKKLEVGCNWGQKTVDVLAARSMFDGFGQTKSHTSPDPAGGR